MGLINYLKKIFSKKREIQIYKGNNERFKNKQISYEETLNIVNSFKNTESYIIAKQYKYKCTIHKLGETKEVRNFECENAKIGEEISDGIVIYKEFEPFLE